MSITTGKDKGISLDPFDGEELEPLPIAADHGLTPVPPPPPIQPLSHESFVCVRGPCRNYVELTTKGELEDRHLQAPVRQVNRFCRVIEGDAIDLTDMAVYECNRWDPESETDDDVAMRKERISEYYRKFPEHRVLKRANDFEDYAQAVSGPLMNDKESE